MSAYFETVIMQRAAYEEIGLSGVTPHFGNRERASVAKAVCELDQLALEISTLFRALAHSAQEAA